MGLFQPKNGLFSSFSRLNKNSDGGFGISIKNEMNHPRVFFDLVVFFKKNFFLENFDDFSLQKPEKKFVYENILFFKISSRMVHLIFDADFKSAIIVFILS